MCLLAVVECFRREVQADPRRIRQHQSSITSGMLESIPLFFAASQLMDHFFLLTEIHILIIPGQTLESYDADSYKTVDYLLSLPTCTGRIGTTGMCLGGHLALQSQRQ